MSCVALEAAREAPLTRRLAPRTILQGFRLRLSRSKRRATDSNPRVNVSPPPAPSPRPPPRALCDLRSRLSRVQRISPLGASRAGRRGDELLLGGGGASVRARALPGLLGRAPRLLRVFFTASAFSAAQGESKRRRLRLRPARPRARLRVPFARRPALGEVFARPLRRPAPRSPLGVGDDARGDLPVDAILLELGARASERGVHSLGARHSAWLNASGSAPRSKNRVLVESDLHLPTKTSRTSEPRTMPPNGDGLALRVGSISDDAVARTSFVCSSTGSLSSASAGRVHQ